MRLLRYLITTGMVSCSCVFNLQSLQETETLAPKTTVNTVMSQRESIQELIEKLEIVGRVESLKRINTKVKNALPFFKTTIYYDAPSSVMRQETINFVIDKLTVRLENLLVDGGVISEELISRLINLMNDQKIYGIVRREIIRLLGNRNLGSEQVILALIKQFSSGLDSQGFPNSAIHALGRIGQPAIPHLVDAIKVDNRYIRFYTTAALAEIGREGNSLASLPTASLLELLEDSNSKVREQTAIVIGYRGHADLEIVEQMLKMLLNKHLNEPMSYEENNYTKWIISLDEKAMSGSEVQSLFEALNKLDFRKSEKTKKLVREYLPKIMKDTSKLNIMLKTERQLKYIFDKASKEAVEVFVNPEHTLLAAI